MGLSLFSKENVIGIFKGFEPGGLEFHAELVLPYREDFQRRPMHGQYLLIELAHPQEAILGRITTMATDGRLAVGLGEEYNIRAVKEDRSIAEELREQYLKYRVNVRLLGILKQEAQELRFVPSLRRLPHLGSKVAYPSDEVLRHIAGHYSEGTPLGYYALGEYLYCGNNTAVVDAGMQAKEPEITPRFSVQSLVSRRSFIFARAGFGKSNLNKYLFSELYKETPQVKKRNGEVPVGTIIFDPDGEYFWPDDKGRPGLCDVPHLQDRLVIFTDRAAPSAFYGSFIASGVKLDLRRFDASDVLGIALEPERQEQQNVRKLRSLGKNAWSELVDLIYRDGNNASIDTICKLIGLEERQEVEAFAARANMTNVVRMLHNSNSLLIDMLLQTLRDGKICVIDISKMRGRQSMILAALILRRIFQNNQEEFVKKDGRTIPTIAVIEEAQTVLHDDTSAGEPFIAWVKEGRKYDLGALLITQQPDSIPQELLSQGDNWFVFHLLSAGDLYALKKANAHFSEDILTSLLNEPIPGQGVFWSSVAGRPYPVSLKIFSFEQRYQVKDPKNSLSAVVNYANKLKQDFAKEFGVNPTAIPAQNTEEESSDNETEDYREKMLQNLTQAVLQEKELMSKLLKSDLSWGALKIYILKRLPDKFIPQEKDKMAFQMVKPLLDRVAAKLNKKWNTYKKDTPQKKAITTIRIIGKE